MKPDSLFLAAALAAGLGLSACGGSSGAPADAQQVPPQVASVQTQAVKQGPLAAPLHAYGSTGFASDDLTTLNVSYAAQVTQLKVTPGQRVRRGAMLLELNPDPSVAATFVQASSTAKAAREEVQRTQALYDKQLATQSQLAAARKAVVDADVVVAELQRQGASPGARAISAPVDGVVTTVAVAQGDRVAAGAALVQLGHEGAARALRVTLGVDPSQVERVRLGAVVHLAPLAGAAESRAGAQGHVLSVKQIVNVQSRLVDVSVAVDSTSGMALLPGMQLAANIETGAATHWIVPRAAVLSDQDGDHVYQVVSGHARRVAVRKAVDADDRYGVDGGLTDGAPVVVSGNYELADGMAVTESRP